MRKTVTGLLHLVLTISAVIAVYPFILMIFGSLKTPVELSANPGGIPRNPTIENYVDLVQYNGGTFIRSFINSVGITIAYLVLSLLISSLAAYSFAKFRFKGKNVIFIGLLSAMMIPSEVLLSPLYIIFSRLHWINTYTVQIVPGIANVFGMFLLRQYMLGIHDSVLESARLDGMGELGIFAKIAFPMSAPAVGAFLILQGLAKWNDFLWPVIFVNDMEYQPLMVLLPLLTTESSSIFATPWTLEMAGCTVATLPIFLLFLLFQDTIMQSVTLGSVKE